MNYYRICPIGVIAGNESLLTYHSEDSCFIGDLVKIPFGKKQKHGIVVESCEKPKFTTKSILERLPDRLPESLISLSVWMSEYYATKLPIILQAMLPSGLGKNRRSPKETVKTPSTIGKLHPLTDSQKIASQKIASSNRTALLHGVTGSGKTRVYQELALKALKKGKSSIILVPEIALTPQLAEAFTLITDNVMVIHSGLTEAQRHIQWQQLAKSKEAWVIVGPRSALFSPLENIGLIVIDECHEPSYHQDSPPKYSALRVARKRADLENIDTFVMGSATPNITDYTYAKSANALIVELPSSVHKRNTRVDIVDLTKRESFGKHPIFSNLLLEKMNKSFVQNEQIMLFHNRRGTARLALCGDCGWHALCKFCHIPMRLHQDTAELRCHMCGRGDPLPKSCPDCHSVDIVFKGFGSKRIENEIKKLFPSANIARFDSDTPESEQLHKRYQQLKNGDIQIIIGTQGIAKGLDLPNLRTIGVVQADSELFIPDFSSNERSFQLISQVVGRAGRLGHESNVIIQTFNPDHPSISYGVNQDYQKFYEHEIQERQIEHMPPHTHLLHLKIGYSSEEYAKNAAEKMKRQLKSKHPNIHIRGPVAAFHERRGNQYYQQLIVSSQRRNVLTEISTKLPQRWSFILDPLNLLG